MKELIVQNGNGAFQFRSESKDSISDYAVNLIRYLNLLYPVFKGAKEKSDFEFISTLMGFRGMQSSGWDPFENTIEIFEKIRTLKTNDEVTKINLFLWVYGHIVEASEPYEILANLLRIIDGERYMLKNFPDIDRGKYSMPQSPEHKIKILTELAMKVNMKECIIPINEIFNKKLRNGIFHSDYSIHNGSVRVRSENGNLNLDSDHTYLLLNNALAYFESFKYLYHKSISDYVKPIEIDLPEGFNYSKGIVMVRKNHGVIGLKDNCTKEQLKQGRMPFRMGKFKEHESIILNIDQTIAFFPEDNLDKLWELYITIYRWTPKIFKNLLKLWYDKKVMATKVKLIKSVVGKSV